MVAGPKGARLTDLAQSGSAKAMLPRVYGPAPEVVFLNTAGGLTTGDRLSYHLELGADTRVTATTQTAERAYAGLAEQVPAQLDVSIEVGPGAQLAWLPQETILFDGAALDRRTTIALAAGAQCLTCETTVLGRAAMGETVRSLHFSDRREITREGRPVVLEPLELSTASLLRQNGMATLGGARVLSSVVLISEDAEDRLEPLRGLLETAPIGVEAAASAWNARLMMRLMSKDGRVLRQVLSRALALLGGSLPRVWQI